MNSEEKAVEIHDIYYQYPTEDRSKDIKGKVYIMSRIINLIEILIYLIDPFLSIFFVLLYN